MRQFLRIASALMLLGLAAATAASWQVGYHCPDSTAVVGVAVFEPTTVEGVQLLCRNVSDPFANIVVAGLPGARSDAIDDFPGYATSCLGFNSFVSSLRYAVSSLREGENQGDINPISYVSLQCTNGELVTLDISHALRRSETLSVREAGCKGDNTAANGWIVEYTPGSSDASNGARMRTLCAELPAKEGADVLAWDDTYDHSYENLLMEYDPAAALATLDDGNSDMSATTTNTNAPEEAQDAFTAALAALEAYLNGGGDTQEEQQQQPEIVRAADIEYHDDWWALATAAEAAADRAAAEAESAHTLEWANGYLEAAERDYESEQQQQQQQAPAAQEKEANGGAAAAAWQALQEGAAQQPHHYYYDPLELYEGYEGDDAEYAAWLASLQQQQQQLPATASDASHQAAAAEQALTAGNWDLFDYEAAVAEAEARARAEAEAEAEALRLQQQQREEEEERELLKLYGCGPGCAKCDGDTGNCISCERGFYIDSNHISCSPCGVPGCDECGAVADPATQCRRCAPHLWLDPETLACVDWVEAEERAMAAAGASNNNNGDDNADLFFDFDRDYAEAQALQDAQLHRGLAAAALDAEAENAAAGNEEDEIARMLQAGEYYDYDALQGQQQQQGSGCEFPCTACSAAGCDACADGFGLVGNECVAFNITGAWQRHFYGFDGRKIDVVAFEAGAHYALLTEERHQVNAQFDGIVDDSGANAGAVALTRAVGVVYGPHEIRVELKIGDDGSMWTLVEVDGEPMTSEATLRRGGLNATAVLPEPWRAAVRAYSLGPSPANGEAATVQTPLLGLTVARRGGDLELHFAMRRAPPAGSVHGIVGRSAQHADAPGSGLALGSVSYVPAPDYAVSGLFESDFAGSLFKPVPRDGPLRGLAALGALFKSVLKYEWLEL